MFDVAWSEVMVILVVALVVIGPKDIPVVLRTVKSFMGKLQVLKQEFTSVLDQVAQETELESVKQQLMKEKEAVRREMRTIVDMEGKLQETYDLTDIRPDIRFDQEEEEEEEEQNAPLTTELLKEAEDFSEMRYPVKKETLH